MNCEDGSNGSTRAVQQVTIGETTPISGVYCESQPPISVRGSTGVDSARGRRRAADTRYHRRRVDGSDSDHSDSLHSLLVGSVFGLVERRPIT
ncbi:hypothetical protein CV102_25445 [Natronococcus pandeyae]|uniref:Uncharacterized protein n=1 Tax=Natronococcus pandeyae TaxID=2055836 RepID=A0A8J8Q010_9EURY|nr:hypothetical protein CV102_25445 [Natronococcus pandeyae]